MNFFEFPFSKKKISQRLIGQQWTGQPWLVNPRPSEPVILGNEQTEDNASYLGRPMRDVARVPFLLNGVEGPD